VPHVPTVPTVRNLSGGPDALRVKMTICVWRAAARRWAMN